MANFCQYNVQNLHCAKQLKIILSDFSLLGVPGGWSLTCYGRDSLEVQR